MPVYEYACQACGHEFEREQRITEDPVKACPKCKARKAKRMISRTSFVLKGSGWYSDLYASPGAGKDEKPEGDAAATGDAKQDDKKDGKKPKKGGGKDGKGGGKSGKAKPSKGAKGSKAAA